MEECESSSGDSVYGHFGALGSKHDPPVAALATAQEFRVALRGFTTLHKIDAECGIALHFAPKTLIQVHEIRTETIDGPVTQRCFDTDSTHVDLLHRMEKLVHFLPGTNIIMSKGFIDVLDYEPYQLIRLGHKKFKGQEDSVEIFLIKSDRVDEDILVKFIDEHIDHQSEEEELKAA